MPPPSPATRPIPAPPAARWRRSRAQQLAHGDFTLAPPRADPRRHGAQPQRGVAPAKFAAVTVGRQALVEAGAAQRPQCDTGEVAALQAASQFAAAQFLVQGDMQRLAALVPVENQLEAEALNAWRQLVQVLTHEIMNSLTPVASLSRTACDLLAEAQVACHPT